MDNDQKGISIFCPLCKGYLINSITVHCGHVFCSFCLKEYLLYSSQCPQCCTEIREAETCHNITLDKLVTQYLSKHLPQDFEQYKKAI
jgi:E3 ubiquitin-protein ligase RAD18